jgi:DNA-directed RNA polymerase subunit RPC12/RpoP
MWRHADILLFELTCAAPKCGKSFHEVVRDLAGKDAVPCPYCRTSLDLKDHKRAIEDFMRLATELDKLPRR